MPRKSKIPPEYIKFKEDVEKLGLSVSLLNPAIRGKFGAMVLYKNLCIWHTDSLVKPIPLNKFWTSKAHECYTKTNEKV